MKTLFSICLIVLLADDNRPYIRAAARLLACPIVQVIARIVEVPLQFALP